jgi:UDP-N-acetylglucosamine transferase subunit ALG13
VIFVTVGNHYQSFERLVRKMDEIAGRIDEKVIMQFGTTEYKPVNAKYFDFIESFEEIDRLNKEARVVVSHTGVGSILTALEQNCSFKKSLHNIPHQWFVENRENINRSAEF